MEEIEIAKQLTMELLDRMGVRKEVAGFLTEGNLYLEIKGDQDGILIGKHGRTLESLQTIINRMVNKRLENTMKVILDIDGYRKRRLEEMIQIASDFGEKAKKTNHSYVVGPFNAHDRKIIHITLEKDPSLKTESLGEGELKKVKIIPINNVTY